MRRGASALGDGGNRGIGAIDRDGAGPRAWAKAAEQQSREQRTLECAPHGGAPAAAGCINGADHFAFLVVTRAHEGTAARVAIPTWWLS